MKEIVPANLGSYMCMSALLGHLSTMTNISVITVALLQCCEYISLKKKVSLSWTTLGLELGELKGPFQPKPSYES